MFNLLKQGNRFLRKTLFRRNMASYSKVVASAEEAVKDVVDGSTILFGGFGLVGIPEALIDAVHKKGTKNITAVSNNCGVEDWGLGILLANKQVKKVYGSYVGENKEFERQYLEGELEVELLPQGTLFEKLRAAGAGIPAFYTPIGVGTVIETGGFPILLDKDGKTPLILSKPRPKQVFNGREYLMEESMPGDFGFVKAWKGDHYGNLVFNKTAQNSNPDVARAGRITIAEVEELVEPGQIAPNEVQLPGCYVDRIFTGWEYQKRIEKLIFDRADRVVGMKTGKGHDVKRMKIAQRASKFVRNGMKVNLGIGIPTHIPNFLDPSIKVFYHGENGVMGIAGYPRPGQEDPDLINASKETISIIKGACFFSSSESFGIIRGQHLDCTFLGGMQISQNGDLSNWLIPGKLVKGMGGAMDLVGSGIQVIVCMEHLSKNGQSKILKENTLPLTGKGVADYLITDLAVFQWRDEKMVLIEVAKESSLEQIRSSTAAEFLVDDNLQTF